MVRRSKRTGKGIMETNFVRYMTIKLPTEGEEKETGKPITKGQRYAGLRKR